MVTAVTVGCPRPLGRGVLEPGRRAGRLPVNLFLQLGLVIRFNPCSIDGTQGDPVARYLGNAGTQRPRRGAGRPCVTYEDSDGHMSDDADRPGAMASGREDHRPAKRNTNT